MKVSPLNTRSEHDALIKGSKPVVLQFSAEWCGPCKMISSKIVKMSEEYENIEFRYVDVDKAEELARDYNVSSLPSFFLIKEGKNVNQVIGANESKLRDIIKEL